MSEKLILDNTLKTYEEREPHVEAEINRLGEQKVTNYMKEKI